MSQTSVAHSAYVATNLLGCAFSNELPQSVMLMHPTFSEAIVFTMRSAAGVCDWAQSWGQKVTIRRSGAYITVEALWRRSVDGMTVSAKKLVQLHTPESGVLETTLGHPDTREVTVPPGRLMAALRGVAA